MKSPRTRVSPTGVFGGPNLERSASADIFRRNWQKGGVELEELGDELTVCLGREALSRSAGLLASFPLAQLRPLSSRPVHV